MLGESLIQMPLHLLEGLQRVDKNLKQENNQQRKNVLKDECEGITKIILIGPEVWLIKDERKLLLKWIEG